MFVGVGGFTPLDACMAFCLVFLWVSGIREWTVQAGKGDSVASSERKGHDTWFYFFEKAYDMPRKAR